MALYHVMQIGALLLFQFHTDIAFADDTTASTRIKRQSSCEDRFLNNYGSEHSACIAASSSLTESGVSTADKHVILDVHNQFRRSVSPNATNMLKMSWNDGIAQIAQGWANTCPSSGHDAYAQRQDYDGYETLGQNYGSGHSSWTSVINHWASEVQYYSYENNNSTVAGKVVGHYTQVVWADTFKIGCGYAKCGTAKYYICNYGPAGNYGQKPYVSGNTCADCSSSSNNGLCDCGGMDCDARRAFDRNQCTCTCKYGLLGDDCHVDCANVHERSFCSWWTYKCHWLYKYYCANTCGLCTA